MGECASWFSSLLSDPNWQIRMCGIHCLQRSLAGTMAHHADAVAARLEDKESCVRQAAAIALGCLGRGAVRYQRQLLALLTDDSNHVRYASLVTLGGLLAKARPHSTTIARHLNDKDARC